MNTVLDDSAPCLRCGTPAPAHGEHHHPHKGMGGQGRKVAEHPRVVLCRGCHDDVHMGKFTLTMKTVEIAIGSENGIEVFQRGGEVEEEAYDPRFWSDERLADRWRDGENSALTGLAIQAGVAHAFYQRYKNHERWYERVAEIISTLNGYSVHWRDVYRRVKLYEAFGSHWDTYLRLGKTLALAVAESADVGAALEMAQATKDEGGHTSRDIIRKIRGQPEPKAKTCPSCGALL